MNKVILMGRLTRDAQTRYTEGAEPMAISRFTLAAIQTKKVARFTQRKLLWNRSSLRKVKRQQATTSQDHSQHQTAVMAL